MDALFLNQFLPFFLILFVSVSFSELFRRFNLPWVIALLVAGMLIGPHALGIIQLEPTIRFIGQIGLVFLMFMAGLETRVANLRKEKAHVIVLGLANSIIPFLAGMVLMLFLGFDVLPALLVGIIFISSSVAVVIPTLEQASLIDKHVGRLIVPATVMQDVLSLIALSLLFQTTIEPLSTIPLPFFYIFLFGILFLLRWAVPKVEYFFIVRYKNRNDPFQQEIRVVLMLLVGVVLVFAILGLHPIVAGFFAGLILSDTIKGKYFKDKLRTISYGVFIPIFFVITGARIDISVFYEAGNALVLVLMIVAVSIAAKFGSGWLGGMTVGETRRSSFLIASATIPQLSTTLAVVTIGLETGILSNTLGTALIILSVVSTVISPLFLKLAALQTKEEEEKTSEQLAVREVNSPG